VAVELSELISQLRAEPGEAMRAGEHADPRFELGPVELELTIAVEKKAKPAAKVRFWVVELGTDGKMARSATQRIKLTSIRAGSGSVRTGPTRRVDHGGDLVVGRPRLGRRGGVDRAAAGMRNPLRRHGLTGSVTARPCCRCRRLASRGGSCAQSAVPRCTGTGRAEPV
jgi:hypothetical protein